MFDLNNSPEFHAGLCKVLDSPAHARALARNGHQLAAAEYDTALLSRRIKRLYEELIRERK